MSRDWKYLDKEDRLLLARLLGVNWHEVPYSDIILALIKEVRKNAQTL